MTKTVYEKCPHYAANPDGFDKRERDGKERLVDERLSNKRVFVGCFPCLQARIRERWAQTELGRKHLEHMRRCDLVETTTDSKGFVMTAPKGLLEFVEYDEEFNGQTIHRRGWRISESYRLPTTEATPEAKAEAPEVPETPEASSPDPAELRAFLEPIVAANEKFVGLWKDGKTGPLIGAVMRVSKKYEGKWVEKGLAEIVGGSGGIRTRV